MAPFDRLYTSSCSSVIVNVSISSAVDIQGGVGAQIFSVKY